MRRCIKSQHSSPRNHGLSKSRGIRKRRFGGILCEMSAVSDQATTDLNHMATRTAQVGYLPSRSLRPKNTLALLNTELTFEGPVLLHPYKCCSIAMCQRSSPKLAKTLSPALSELEQHSLSHLNCPDSSPSPKIEYSRRFIGGYNLFAMQFAVPSPAKQLMIHIHTISLHLGRPYLISSVPYSLCSH